MSKAVKIILKYHIPEDEIEALTKCFLPDILDFFESEEGKQEFEQWKRNSLKRTINRYRRYEHKLVPPNLH